MFTNAYPVLATDIIKNAKNNIRVANVRDQELVVQFKIEASLQLYIHNEGQCASHNERLTIMRVSG